MKLLEPRILIIVSLILHYLKSTGKVPSWVQRVHIFMDNAGSTNKNQYMMASIFEIVQQSVVKYFRVSFMVAGHTKFAPDRLFALTAKAFYSSDIFNEKELSVMENHANVTFDSGRIVRCWQNTVTQKYTNLPGIRDLHDFLALKNPDTDAVMKVRENCYAGTLKNTSMRTT